MFAVSRRFQLVCSFLALAGCAELRAADNVAVSAYKVLQKAGCAGCHNPDGVASGTRLRFPEGSASDEALREFGASLNPLINRQQPDQSLLIRKPTRRIAHAGGKRIEPGSADETSVLAWIAELARQEPSATTTAKRTEVHKPAAPVLRRLTHAQYNNTIRDLLGDDSRIADNFPAEDFVNGFRNQYQGQSISPILAEAYAGAAERITSKAFSGDTSKFLPCKATDPGCRDKFIRDFGRRAFRRPLEPAEVQRYQRLFAVGGGKFDAGARLVMEAMLQSPNFLLRTENGANPAWRRWETASRLSYFLWNSMPDEALFRSAESGELDTAAGLERATRRLLKDPRSHDAMGEFLSEWLRFDRLTGTVRDRRMYPQFSPELIASMLGETRRLFDEVAWNKRNFMELYSADYAILSSDLAALYGVKAPAKEPGRVALSDATERAGVLGQATFLALTSKPAETSPTARGLFVREQFLCQEVPQPPPGVNANLPALTKEKPQTNRERLGIHLNNESCASCHTLIDPIGFGFEKFDAIGQRREKQAITFRPGHGEKNEAPATVELDVDTRGQVAGIPDSAFSTPRELGRILAGSKQCQECVVKQLFRYAAGRHETTADRVIIGNAYEDFRRSGFQFQDLLVALTKWWILPTGVDDGSSSGY